MWMLLRINLMLCAAQPNGKHTQTWKQTRTHYSVRVMLYVLICCHLCRIQSRVYSKRLAQQQDRTSAVRSWQRSITAKKKVTHKHKHTFSHGSWIEQHNTLNPRQACDAQSSWDRAELGKRNKHFAHWICHHHHRLYWISHCSGRGRRVRMAMLYGSHQFVHDKITSSPAFTNVDATMRSHIGDIRYIFSDIIEHTHSLLTCTNNYITNAGLICCRSFAMRRVICALINQFEYDPDWVETRYSTDYNVYNLVWMRQ